LGRPVVAGAGGLFAATVVAVSLASLLPVVTFGVAMLTAGFFAVHGVASGWAASTGQGRQAASQALAFYLLAYHLGASVFGAHAAATRGQKKQRRVPNIRARTRGTGSDC
jgi:YNFM family putative membrane transporter